MSRPSDYTPETAAAICDRLSEGLSLREVCGDEAMPAMSTVFRWLADQAGFREQYARAREAQADYFAEEILEIADDGSNDWMDRAIGNGRVITVPDHEHISRSKLRVDARKWLMAKLAPKKYGERVAAELTGKDGGPIQTENLSDLEVARRVAFLLARATQDNPQE
jgi:hypothetical protein